MLGRNQQSSEVPLQKISRQPRTEGQEEGKVWSRLAVRVTPILLLQLVVMEERLGIARPTRVEDVAISYSGPTIKGAEAPPRFRYRQQYKSVALDSHEKSKRNTNFEGAEGKVD